MVARRLFGVCVLALLVARCVDQPTAPSTPRLQFVPWAMTPQFSATANVPHGGNGGEQGALLSSPLSLDQYSVSFWAVRGEARSVTINYSTSGDTVTRPFLQFTTTDPFWVPDRGELAIGDSVLITLSVDTTNLGVKLEPSGLQFGAAADLKIWYGGAGGDLNGDATVDSTDTYIEMELLSVAYRQGDTAWELIASSHSIEEQWFAVALPHFSEYVLSFADWVVSW